MTVGVDWRAQSSDAHPRLLLHDCCDGSEARRCPDVRGGVHQLHAFEPRQRFDLRAVCLLGFSQPNVLRSRCSAGTFSFFFFFNFFFLRWCSFQATWPHHEDESLIKQSCINCSNDEMISIPRSPHLPVLQGEVGAIKLLFSSTCTDQPMHWPSMLSS